MEKRVKRKLMRFSLVFLITLIVQWTAAPVYAQPSATTEEAAAYQNPFEEAISNRLLQYIAEKDFMVHVSFRRDTSVRSLSDEPETINYYSNLPGIFIPQLTDSSRAYYEENQRSRGAKLKVVDIMLSNIYDSSDVLFIANLVKRSIPFNEQKGDQLIISQVKFPRGPAGVSDSVNEENWRRYRETGNASEISGGPTYHNTLSNTQPSDTLRYNQRSALFEAGLGDNVIPLLLLLVLLLILGLLVYIIFRGKGRKKPKKSKARITPDVPDSTAGAGQNIHEEEKQQMIALFIKSPKTISSIIESEILSNGQDALSKYVKAIAASNPDLHHLLQPYLNSVTYANLIKSIEEQKVKSEPAHEEITQIINRLKTFRELDTQGIFSFLSRINDKQLLFLLRDEKAETVAITIAQLNAERAQKLLAGFSESLRSEILIHMGQIAVQPSSAFKEVALRLSNKLPELEGLKDISTDGLAGVLNILDTLTEDAQAAMLEKIREKSPQMAEEIKKLFVGFSNIVKLDDTIVEKAVRDIDTTEIIQALSGYDQAVHDKVLTTRPTREQMIIRSQLEENNQPLEAGIVVRRKIILSIRTQLKTL